MKITRKRNRITRRTTVLTMSAKGAADELFLSDVYKFLHDPEHDLGVFQEVGVLFNPRLTQKP